MRSAQCLAIVGRRDEAAILLRDAMETLEASLGPDHPLVSECAGALSDIRAAELAPGGAASADTSRPR